MAAMTKDTVSAGPAVKAPVPVSTKMPVPMMAPMPISTRSTGPSTFFRLQTRLSTSMASMSLVRNKLI